MRYCQHDLRSAWCLRTVPDADDRRMFRLVGGPPDGSCAIYFVSCVGQKLSVPAAARDLYTPPWCRKVRSCVESTGQRWFILSAKHGVVHPDEVIEPYDLTLNAMGIGDRRRWADRLISQLEPWLGDHAEVRLLAGMRYREFIQPWLAGTGVRVTVPMEGLRIGEQLS